MPITHRGTPTQIGPRNNRIGSADSGVGLWMGAGFESAEEEERRGETAGGALPVWMMDVPGVGFEPTRPFRDQRF